MCMYHMYTYMYILNMYIYIYIYLITPYILNMLRSYKISPKERFGYNHPGYDHLHAALGDTSYSIGVAGIWYLL